MFSQQAYSGSQKLTDWEEDANPTQLLSKNNATFQEKEKNKKKPKLMKCQSYKAVIK